MINCMGVRGFDINLISIKAISVFLRSTYVIAKDSLFYGQRDDSFI